MIKLENVNKSYNIKNKKYEVLKNVNVIFKNKEFVSILGPSGSGKTTLLNIIGGLDKDYEGTVYFNNKNISLKKEKFYDYYRNHKIGFVFQDYNLINNYSVYQNVELPLIINSKGKRKKQVYEALSLVDILKYKDKKVNELSGGEKQRVAIARAIVNKPDVLLLDEPTGALDSKTSIIIMKLIKELSKDMLVIMVTHNEFLAKEYSDRILTISDGLVKGVSTYKEEVFEEVSYKKMGISFFNSFKLSFRNLKLKLFRNILTVLAFMISIMGISFVFAMTTGFNKQVSLLEEDSLGNYPLTITENREVLEDSSYERDMIYSYSGYQNNSLKSDVVQYVKDIDSSYIAGITYNYDYAFKAISKTSKGFKYSDNLPFIAIPNDNIFIKENYELIDGKYPKDDSEVLLKVNSNNRLSTEVLTFLGFKNEVSLDKLVGKEFKLVYNNDLYYESNGSFFVNNIDKDLYNKNANIKLKIVGIIKPKSKMDFNTVINEEAGAIYFKNSLVEKILEKNNKSLIVKKQKEVNKSVLSGEVLEKKEKEILLNYLGSKENPYLIYIYPDGYKNKEKILNYLDSSKKDINYIDMATDVLNTTFDLVFGVTSVLLILSGVSLIITLILITIITYTSSVERRKEIGILRSMGARRKDIKRLFIMENISISLIASLFSLLLVKLLSNPLNKTITDITGLNDLLVLSFDKVILIIIISVLVALLGSIIPALKASKTDPVLSLREL